MAEGYAQFFGGAVTCGTCRFYVPTEKTLAGRCHRFPPQIVVTPERVNLLNESPARGMVDWEKHTDHPTVFPDNWCGEHYPAPTPEPVTPPARGRSDWEGGEP